MVVVPGYLFTGRDFQSLLEDGPIDNECVVFPGFTAGRDVFAQ
jgi:hypothetical protein